MKTIELDYFDWAEEYQPLDNRVGGADMAGVDEYSQRFETFGEELRTVQFALAFFPRHVWTEVETGRGCAAHCDR